jgi:integrase
MAQSTARRRGNGEGSLFHDKARNRWRGMVAWTEPDGTLRRRTVSGETQAEARRKVAALRADLDKGRRPTPTTTVADFLTGWLEAERVRVRASTWRYRDGHVRLYLVPALGNTKLARLTPRDVEAMLAAMLARGLAPRTAAGCRTTLRKALSDAVRDGLVHGNAAALAHAPHIPGRAIDYLSRDELGRLLEACEGESMGPLVVVAANTGLRQGELLGLAWADVDTTARALTVRQALARSWDGFALAAPKTNRSRRTIHLPERALAALAARRTAQDAERTAAGEDWQDRHGLVFTDVLGRPWNGTVVTRAFQALLAQAGIRRVPFHALRHSWATLALASGVPLKVIADNLGHASIAVTAAFYSGIVPELNRDAADAIERALA